jgi:hypothetical protein
MSNWFSSVQLTDCDQQAGGNSHRTANHPWGSASQPQIEKVKTFGKPVVQRRRCILRLGQNGSAFDTIADQSRSVAAMKARTVARQV